MLQPLCNPDGQAHRSARDETFTQTSSTFRAEPHDIAMDGASLCGTSISPLFCSPQRLRQSQSWALEVFAPQVLAALVPTLDLLRVGLVVQSATKKNIINSWRDRNIQCNRILFEKPNSTSQCFQKRQFKGFRINALSLVRLSVVAALK